MPEQEAAPVDLPPKPKPPQEPEPPIVEAAPVDLPPKPKPPQEPEPPIVEAAPVDLPPKPKPPQEPEPSIDSVFETFPRKPELSEFLPSDKGSFFSRLIPGSRERALGQAKSSYETAIVEWERQKREIDARNQRKIAERKAAESAVSRYKTDLAAYERTLVEWERQKREIDARNQRKIAERKAAESAVSRYKTDLAAYERTLVEWERQKREIDARNQRKIAERKAAESAVSRYKTDLAAYERTLVEWERQKREIDARNQRKIAERKAAESAVSRYKTDLAAYDEHSKSWTDYQYAFVRWKEGCHALTVKTQVENAKARGQWQEECNRIRATARRDAKAQFAVNLERWEAKRDERIKQWEAVCTKMIATHDLAHAATLEAWQAECETREKAADKQHQAALSKWQAKIDAAEAAWTDEKAKILKEWHMGPVAEAKRAHRAAQADLDEVERRFYSGDPEAAAFAFERLLTLSTDAFCADWLNRRADYDPESRVLRLDIGLPDPGRLPRVKEVRYIKSRGECKNVELSPSERKELYQSFCYQVALASLHKVFTFDREGLVGSVAINGSVAHVDPATGRDVRPCILSLHVTPEELQGIDLLRVVPKECFRKLKGVASASLIDLAAVAPLVSFDTSDRRFVAGHEVLTTEGENIATMPWEEFEHLVRNLFEWEFSENGSEVKVTQASRDGGVDAVIFDPDPLRGGKIVIQAKRYTNVVGVSAVRDLYGTVQHEGANKGVLVTTSSFGPDAYIFVKDKPLVLLDGGQLLHLLAKHGRKVRINLAEAKAFAAESTC